MDRAEHQAGCLASIKQFARLAQEAGWRDLDDGSWDNHPSGETNYFVVMCLGLSIVGLLPDGTSDNERS